MGCPFLICLAKAMQHIIFYAHFHAGSPSYTNGNKRHRVSFIPR